MKHLFVPWGYALRGLVFRAPEGPRTPPVPVVPPPDLMPPETLPHGENGYVALAAHVRDWPAEGHTAPDLLHRLRALPDDRVPAERALAPLRPLFEGLDPILAMPRWQILVNADFDWPELNAIRRLTHALLLRGALEGREDDRERALTIARRLRRAQSPMMHFLVGVALEKTAEGDFPGLEADRKDAIHWEMARVILPHLHLGGPWEPSRWSLPAAWQDERRAVQWLLAGNPLPYHPAATAATLVASQGLMASGAASDLKAEAGRVAAAWPASMRTRLDGQVGGVSLSELRRIRPALQSLPNAYGLLGVARALNAAASLAQAVERTRA